MKSTIKKIETILSKENNKLLEKFIKLYLPSFSKEALEKESDRNLAQFIKKRFDFLKEGIKKDNYYRLYPSENTNLNNKMILETVYPDTTFFLITILTLLKEYNLTITRLLHPVISIEFDSKNALINLSDNFQKGTLVSLIYIEFEGLGNQIKLNELKSRLNYHIESTICAHKDNTKLSTQLETIKTKLKKTTIQTAESKNEWINLIDWLQERNFTLIGYIPFIHKKNQTEKQTICDESKGLGVLSKKHLSRDNHKNIKILSAHIWRLRHQTQEAFFDSIKVKSPIHRFENLMRLSFRIKEKNEIIEHNFVGLLRTSSLLVKNMETPLIHQKIKSIIENRNIIEGSYSYNSLIRVTTSIPKFELFRTPTQTLAELFDKLMATTNPNELYCFNLHNPNPTKLTIIVIVPQRLFNEENIEKISTILNKEIPHIDSEMFQIKSYDYCWLTYHFENGQKSTFMPSFSKIEALIREEIKPWAQKFSEALSQVFPGNIGRKIYELYRPALPPHYEARKTPEDAVLDVEYLEKLAHDGTIQFRVSDFTFESSALSGKSSLITIYNKTKIDLISIMPILDNLGLHVYDELTTKISSKNHMFGYIHSFRVSKDQIEINHPQKANQIVNLLNAIFKKFTENDPLNGLVISTDLNWRSINVLQTYRNIYHQLEAPYSIEKINNVLLMHSRSTEVLFSYFKSKFSLSDKYGKQDYRKNILLPQIALDFRESLENVESVADDTILRAIFNLIEHTLRTNFYIPKDIHQTGISIKLNSNEIKQMPQPAPYREIYVHDVGIEGTHLRFGPIARGGLRWSDRPFDFRREILGLATTQQTKNVVIVPVGSKGGFVIKNNALNKKERAAESEKQYKIFIENLLDITDNLDEMNNNKPPNHVMCYDSPDSYLVVAADKGTANFSDLANSISSSYDFWLEDAFASGGSQGYNHKVVGITARGAWESAKLHFKEINIDLQKDPVSVTAIGDMSGDVFGNGMLLSKTIRLIAAFNHMHIFFDPNPNASASWEERNRLFKETSSTWLDYDQSIISKGGGIFERKSKCIVLSKEMMKWLNTSQKEMNGEELIKRILTIKVQMLFFGGIGTYIKSSSETQLEVGDPANNSVRVNANDIQAKVIVEGANLGCSQKARIEFNQLGGKINTDAIDNSAGVNMSDMEVNLKILMQILRRENILKSNDDRNKTLRMITEKISQLCLENNQHQHRLISMDQLRSKSTFHIYKSLIGSLIYKNNMHSNREHVTEKDLIRYESQSKGVPRPILATVQAFVKMEAFTEICQSPLLDHEFFEPFYIQYFPKEIIKLSNEIVFTHPLKKEILATILTNEMVNNGGCSFIHELQETTGAPIDIIMEHYMVYDYILNGKMARENWLENHPLPIAYDAIIEQQKIMRTLIKDTIQLPNLLLELSHYKKLKDLIKTITMELPKTSSSHVKQSTPTHKLLSEQPILFHYEILPKLLHYYFNSEISLDSAVKILTQLKKSLNLNALQSLIFRINPQNAWENEQLLALKHKLSFAWLKLSQIILTKKPRSYSPDHIATVIHDEMGASIKQYLQVLKRIKPNQANLSNISVAIFKLETIANNHE